MHKCENFLLKLKICCTSSD